MLADNSDFANAFTWSTVNSWYIDLTAFPSRMTRNKASVCETRSRSNRSRSPSDLRSATLCQDENTPALNTNNSYLNCCQDEAQKNVPFNIFPKIFQRIWVFQNGWRNGRKTPHVTLSRAAEGESRGVESGHGSNQLILFNSEYVITNETEKNIYIILAPHCLLQPFLHSTVAQSEWPCGQASLLPFSLHLVWEFPTVLQMIQRKLPHAFLLALLFGHDKTVSRGHLFAFLGLDFPQIEFEFFAFEHVSIATSTVTGPRRHSSCNETFCREKSRLKSPVTQSTTRQDSYFNGKRTGPSNLRTEAVSVTMTGNERVSASRNSAKTATCSLPPKVSSFCFRLKLK